MVYYLLAYLLIRKLVSTNLHILRITARLIINIFQYRPSLTANFKDSLIEENDFKIGLKRAKRTKTRPVTWHTVCIVTVISLVKIIFRRNKIGSYFLSIFGL